MWLKQLTRYVLLGSGNLKGRLFFLCLTIFLSLEITATSPPPPSIVVRGAIAARQQKDTLYLTYDLTFLPYRRNIDSILFSLGDSVTGSFVADSLLVTIIDSVPYVSNNRFARERRSGLRSGYQTSGTLAYLISDSVRFSSYRILIFYRGGYLEFESGQQVELGALNVPAKPGMLMGIGYGWFDPSSNNSIDRQKVDGLDMQLGMQFQKKYLKTYIHSNFVGAVGKRESTILFEKLSCRVQFTNGKANRWFPWPVLGITYASFEAKNYEGNFFKEGTGLAAGLTINRRFEQVSYLYNTHLGGYHQVEAFFAIASSPVGRVGTRYTFFEGDDFRILKAQLYFERNFEVNAMTYANNRNIGLKILGLGLLTPLVIFVVIGGVPIH